MKRYVALLLMMILIVPVLPLTAQESCGDLPPRLVAGGHGNVIAGIGTVPVYSEPGYGTSPVGAVTEDDKWFEVLDGPDCVNGVNWWQVNTMSVGSGWLGETAGGQYVVEPYVFVPVAPVALDVPMNPPVISTPEVPVPAVIPSPNPAALDNAYANWDWETFMADSYYQAPDPLTMQLPDAYAGDLPTLPIDLNNVYFVADANLNQQQLELLAQNGFVVVPGDTQQFDDMYRGSAWSHNEGKADFITTDALLHSLFVAYQNTLMFAESGRFYGQVVNFVAGGYEAAEAQVKEAVDTPLETPARNTAVYYAVALTLLADGQEYYVGGYDNRSAFLEGDRIPSKVLANADPAILAEAQPIVDMIRSAEGRLDVPFLENYQEDFSQYKVRGYYAGDKLLESYFRAMMWMGRITFTVRSETDTLASLLVLRALQNADGAYANWESVADTLTFLVGPMDDYSPADYGPLAEGIFGTGLPLSELANTDKLTAFRDAVKALPGPRINSIPLPMGTTADQVDALTRGFRLFGQRFTFDGYVMQQLIYPEVGTASYSRALPLGLDVAAVLGSDTAFALADEAGATGYEKYTEHVAALRDEVNSMDGNAWMENLYGGWLWALQPLLVRDSALVPPMMQTDAWKRKDINTSLGSWTELKHATVLYAEQPMGGLGGGGPLPPVISYSYVEPNPLVFSRIAIVAETLRQGLDERGMFPRGVSNGMSAIDSALGDLSLISAQLAEMARKEVAGEPLTHDEAYFLQENFGSRLWYIRYVIEEWITDPPETVALVTDVASNADAEAVLQEGIGNVDTIYVITNSPYGLQVTRGGVFSTYEFVNDIDKRMTDDEWRAMVADGTTPARPAWIDLYFSE
jgi:hypothetical protein